MDISDVASYFNDQPINDAYTAEFLFNGQPDLFDGTTRDSETGWRRTLTSVSVVAPARGCIEFGSDYYLMGRLVKDFFQGSELRSSVVIHPSDGLFSLGSSAEVIAAGTLTTFHAAHALRKEVKEVVESSQSFNTVSIYVSESEAAIRDQVLIGPTGTYYRVQNLLPTTSGYSILVCSELGDAALQSVSYTAAGAYDPVTDVKGAAAPILTSGIVERHQTNYRYVNQANAKYEVGDKIVTMLKSIVTSPEPEESLTISGIVYRILEAQDDGAGCWELHVRANS